MSENPPKWEPPEIPETDRYILKYRKPVPEPDLLKWGSWYEHNFRKRRVRLSFIGSYKISTVFLGLDHGWNGDILLFETMVFSKELNDGEDLGSGRCRTWRQALKMHREFKERFKRKLKNEPIL